MRTYATPDDLTDWMTPTAAPGNAAGLLRSASFLIEGATRLAVYPVDNDGMPTDPKHVQAFRDATTAQAQYWHAMGIDPMLGAAGVKPQASSKSINGASIEYSTYASTAEARANAAGELGPDAYHILAQAGLLGGKAVAL